MWRQKYLALYSNYMANMVAKLYQRGIYSSIIRYFNGITFAYSLIGHFNKKDLMIPKNATISYAPLHVH